MSLIHNNHQYLNGDFRFKRSEPNGGRTSSCGTISYTSSPPHFVSSTCSSTAQTTINNHLDGVSNKNAPFSRLATFYLQESNPNFISSKSIQLLLEVETHFNEIREEISIRILDPNDPFFIYLYLIDFNEYKKIKQAQNLLVSFERFSPKLIDMFQKCCPDTTTTTRSMPPQHHSDSSYILCLRNLSRVTLTLDIIELNEFRNIIHLSFDIPSASEEFVRSNYCTIYRKLKTETESLRQQISSLDDQLSSMTISKAKELQSLKMEFASEKQFLEEKLKDTEQKFTQEQNKWNDTDRCLKAKLQKLQSDLKIREEFLEKERKDHEQQYQEWKEKLNQEITKRHNKLKELDEKNQQLMTEIKLLKIERDQTSHIAAKNEDEMEAVKNDLLKANEIIRKLQNEVKSSQDKIRILNEVTQKQEEIVGIKESTVERISLDLKLCLQQLKNKEKEIERLNFEYDSQKSHCSQLELQLTASKKIIVNLQKELDRLKLEKDHIENERFKNLRFDDQNDDEKIERMSSDVAKSQIQPSSTNSKNKIIMKSKTTDNLCRQQLQNNKDVNVNNEKKNFLFTNVSKELPLKTVNLRTTNANRNQTNVLSSALLNPKRKSII